MSPHGTPSRYAGGCRCADCTEAVRIYRSNYRAAKIADGFAGMTHGVIGTYMTGCRCDECRESRRLYARHNVKGRAFRTASNRAAKWMRQHHPEEWQELLSEVTAELEATT